MKDECTNPQQLGDEQLETVSGGAGEGTRDMPCKWDSEGNPPQWYDINQHQK